MKYIAENLPDELTLMKLVSMVGGGAICPTWRDHGVSMSSRIFDFSNDRKPSPPDMLLTDPVCPLFDGAAFSHELEVSWWVSGCSVGFMIGSSEAIQL